MTNAAHSALTTSGTLTPDSFARVDPGLGESLAESLVEVERILDVAVTQRRRLPDETSHHLLAAGGKRVRPMLVLLTAHFGSADTEAVRKAAAAVELIHLATLYHDDVMDDAPVRRGAPAAHEVWGNSVAILTGDILFSRASMLSAELGPRAVRLQAETFERLVLGQLAEFTGPEGDDDPIAHYLQVLSDKTGSLIAASGEFGILTSGAPESLVPAVREYGEKVGVAFQIADDIIDLTTGAAKSGKTPGTDLREGVPTLPTLLVRAAAAKGEAEAARIVGLLDADLSSDEALEEARAALAAHRVTEETRAEARSWSQAAIDALAELPDGTVKNGLVEFATSVVDRVA